jgi:hypothetical protein
MLAQLNRDGMGEQAEELQEQLQQLQQQQHIQQLEHDAWDEDDRAPHHELWYQPHPLQVIVLHCNVYGANRYHDDPSSD